MILKNHFETAPSFLFKEQSKHINIYLEQVSLLLRII